MSNGWGSAELGGGYRSAWRGFSALDVESGSGRVRVGTDASGWAWLDATAVRDVDVTLPVSAAVNGAGSISAGPVVRAGDNGMYSVRLEASDGSAVLLVDLIETGTDSDTRLVGPIAVPVEAFTDGRPVTHARAGDRERSDIHSCPGVAGRAARAQ